MNTPKIELRKVTKNDRLSEETRCWAGDLYVDNVLGAHCSNHGTGGGDNIHWVNAEAKKKFRAHLETLPPVDLGSGMVVPMDEELFINELLEKTLILKNLKRWCKTKTVLAMKNAKPGEYVEYKVKFSPQVKAHFLAKYGENIVEFVNERPGITGA